MGMVMWAKLLSDEVKAPIVANFNPLGNSLYFDNWKTLKDIKNSIILFDELGTSIDSRNFKSEDQINFTHIFSQLAKKGNTFLYSAQRLNLVDKRVRDQTDYLILCNKDWNTGILSQTWLDTQQGMIGARFIGEYIIHDPAPFYDLYDGFEFVKTTMVTGEMNQNWKKKPWKPWKKRNYDE